MNAPDEHRHHAPRAVGFAILTVSDSRSAEDDRSGDAIENLAKEAGHTIVARDIVRDEPSDIRALLERFLGDDNVNVIITTGGTGIAPRDITIETIRPRFEKELPGFGEIFRALSHEEIGSAAFLSRATAGTASGRVIFVLPGSPAACRLAMTRLVLPEAAHLVGLLRRALDAPL